MGQDVWPLHAYVPGKTARHAKNAFDSMRETAQSGLSPYQLAQSRAFCVGLTYLKAGFYWEAHEVFEPVWIALPNPSRERQFVQGLIQIANGFLKVKMERPKAAARLEGIARQLVLEEWEDTIMGVDKGEIRAMIDSLNDEIKSAF